MDSIIGGGKIIIVGASSGIGRAVALRYLASGWKVGVAARRISELQEIKNAYPEQVEYAQIDILADDAANVVNQLVERLGGMNIYLHVAGIGSQNLSLVPETELATCRTNVVGFTRMIDWAYNYFSATGGGHIAVVSSIAGTKGLGSAPAYSATKRYQNTYIESLEQLARINCHNIRFTDICPGFVKTSLLSDGNNYPMLMTAEYVAKKVISALSRRRRVVIINWKYALLVFFWRLIPRALWIRLPIKTSKAK